MFEVYSSYVLPQRAWFLSQFDLKTGIDFDYFGLKLGKGFLSLLFGREAF